MIDANRTQDVLSATAYSTDGDKLGKVGQLFLDDATGQPEFVTVNTGLFGTSESFVPVDQASLDGDRLVVPFDKDTVKNAPKVDLDGGHLDEAGEERLFSYYGRGGRTAGTTGTTTGTADRVDDRETTYDSAAAAGTAGTDGTSAGTDGTSAGTHADRSVGHDTSGPTTDEAMTRSEEHLEVGTQQAEAGRARLRKYVTTETETVEVPVRKERAVLESEPVTDADRGDALDGPSISEEEHEVVLHEERPVVETVAEPVERVRLGTETYAETETVSGEVREEHVEVEGDVQGGVQGDVQGGTERG